MTTTRLVAAAAALLTAAAVTAGAGPAGADVPRLIDLGTLPGGHSSVVFGGDGAGLWVGASDDGSGQRHAVYWDSAGIHDLGFPTSPEMFADPDLGAPSVNRHDVIAVNAAVATGSDVTRAYLWQAGHSRMLRLPARATPEWSSIVRRITDGGVAVGEVGEFPGPNGVTEDHPAIWSSATAAPRLLSFPDAFDGGFVEDVNSHGVAVGFLRSDLDVFPWEWDAAGHGHPLGPTGSTGQAFVIDDAGVAAGVSATDTAGDAPTFWSSGHTRRLPFDGGFAGSNYRGSSVGLSFGSSDSCCPLIYRSGSSGLTLLPLSRHLGDAAQSWVVTVNNTVGGSSDIGNGDMHATLWTHAFQQGFVPPASVPPSSHPARSIPGPLSAARP